MTTKTKVNPNIEKNITKKSNKGGGQTKNEEKQFICVGKNCKEHLQFGKNIEYTSVYLPDKSMVIRITCKKCGQKYEIYKESTKPIPVDSFKKTWNELTNVEKAEIKATRIRENAVKTAETIKLRMENMIKVRNEYADRIIESAIAREEKVKLFAEKDAEIKKKIDEDLVKKADEKRTRKAKERLKLFNKTLSNSEKVKSTKKNVEKQPTKKIFSNKPIVKNKKIKEIDWQKKAEFKAIKTIEKLEKESVVKAKQKKLQEKQLEHFLISEKRRKEKKIERKNMYLTKGGILKVKTKLNTPVRKLSDISKNEMKYYTVETYEKNDEGKTVLTNTDSFSTTLGSFQINAKTLFDNIVKKNPNVREVKFIERIPTPMSEYLKNKNLPKYTENRTKIALCFACNTRYLKSLQEKQKAQIVAA